MVLINWFVHLTGVSTQKGTCLALCLVVDSQLPNRGNLLCNTYQLIRV